MNVRTLAQRRWPYAALAAVALLISCFWGPKALAGLSIGLFGAGFNMIALWYVIGLLGQAAKSEAAGRRGSTVIVIAFFLKLPVYIAMGVLANRIGNPAPACFLGGVGLVYSCLVGWALARS